MSTETESKESLTVGFGDTILLPHDTIGTVRFIGYTEFKKNIIFYGIHLKDAIGKNNGSFGNRKYFKCPKSHGIFTEKRTILDILKKHSISASFHYGQSVQIINSANNSTLGRGVLRYIGLTKHDNYKNYYYGVKLDESMKQKQFDEIKSNSHIQTAGNKNIYFDAEPKRSIFVRQNQLRCIAIKSLNRKRPNHLNTKRAAAGKKKPRAQSMLPQSKTQKKKLKAKVKKRKSMKAKTAKKALQIANNSPNTEKKKKSKQNPKKKSAKKKKANAPAKKEKEPAAKKDKTRAKRKKIKKQRETRKIKSDLGQIRATRAKPHKIDILSSKDLGTEFNGCVSPSKTPSTKSSKNKRKSIKKSKPKENINPNASASKSAKKRPAKLKLNRKRSTSTITVDAKYTKNKNKNSVKTLKKRKTKGAKKKAVTRSKSVAKPKKKAKRKSVATNDDNTAAAPVISRNRTTSYDAVINNEDTFCRYVDAKHFYYHQQYTKQYKKDDAHVIVNRIRQRSVQQGPPTMGSFFSTRSRMNQRKKRQLPSAPHVYSIEIQSRPMGFFIETKKLYTITENKDGEQVTEQVEIADKDNKFNKVNAYISMVQAEEWESVLIVGSQLLSINSESITGLSFGTIFQKLSSHALPFTLELAAPNTDENESPLNSPKEHGDSEDEAVDHSRRLVRGQTFDETKAAGTTERKHRFRFHLF